MIKNFDLVFHRQQTLVVVFQLLSHIWLFTTPWTAACQASLSFTVSWSLLKSCPLSWWCYLTIPSSVAPFSFWLQSFSASGSFPMSWLFASGSQSIGASASVLPMNIQGCLRKGLMPRVGPQPPPLLHTAEPQRMRHKGCWGSRCVKPTAGTWHFWPGQPKEIIIHPAFSFDFPLQVLFLLSTLTLLFPFLRIKYCCWCLY